MLNIDSNDLLESIENKGDCDTFLLKLAVLDFDAFVDTNVLVLVCRSVFGGKSLFVFVCL